MLTINQDLDGCVCSFDRSLGSYIEHQLGLPEGHYGTPTSWNTWEDWDMTWEEFRSWWHRASIDHWVNRKGPEIPGAIPALWRLHGQGHRIRLVTDRFIFPELKADTITNSVAWLRDHNVPYDAIVFDAKKHEIPADVVVDDKPTLAWAQSDALNILFDQPWNREELLDFNELGASVIRARGWDEVLKLIETEAMTREGKAVSGVASFRKEKAQVNVR